MSDITPADALRELGDDQAEYAAAAAKKAASEQQALDAERRAKRLEGIRHDLFHDYRPLGNGWPTYTVRFLADEVARLTKVLDEIRDVINDPANSYVLEAKQTRGVLMRHMGSDWLSAEDAP